MTFNQHAGLIFISAALLALAGCPGQDENSAESGLTVHFAEVHLQEQLPAAATAKESRPLQSTLAALAAPGGYDQNNLEHHDIVDNNNHLLSIYRAYLVLDDLELVACTNLAQLPRRLFNSIISTASAHAGHGSEPVGGRSLDKPNVIDIVTRDQYLLPLGDLAVAPGSYCGVRVSLARLVSESYGEPNNVAASNDNPTTMPEVPDLAGKFFSMRADYCVTGDGLGGCLQRSKVDVDDSALALPPLQTVNFNSPLTVTDARRSGYVAVGIAYGEWAQDIDVALLTSNADERQKLVNNIATSIHVYAKGLGDLPVNVAE